MDFKACTIHLARLFDAWWYNAVFKCVIPLCFSNPWNSKLENTTSLAEINVSGSSSIANVFFDFWFITAAGYVAIISNHLLCASIRYQTKHPLRHEQTANTVHVDSQQGLSGHSHGWSGASSGIFLLIDKRYRFLPFLQFICQFQTTKLLPSQLLYSVYSWVCFIWLWIILLLEELFWDCGVCNYLLHWVLNFWPPLKVWM